MLGIVLHVQLRICGLDAGDVLQGSNNRFGNRRWGGNMETFGSESIFIRQILNTDRRSIGTRIGVGTLDHLRLQVLVAQILHKPLCLCLLAVAGRVSKGEAAIRR